LQITIESILDMKPLEENSDFSDPDESKTLQEKIEIVRPPSLNSSSANEKSMQQLTNPVKSGPQIAMEA
jgi:hypothetical protein